MNRKAYLDQNLKYTALPMLRIILAIMRAQYLNYQTCHWQARGPSYYGNHLLFQRMYEGVQDEIDALGEKIVGYFGVEGVDLDVSMDLVTDMLGRWREKGCLFQRGLVSETELQAALDILHKGWPNKPSMPLGLEDWIAATANAHETNQYLLQQTLSSSGVIRQAGYGRDPYWIVAKYPGKDRDGTPFRRGDRVFYYPATKTFLAGPKAEAASREFEALAADDDFGSRYASVAEVAPSAEGHFFDAPYRRETRGFAESKAPTNDPDVGKRIVKEHGNGNVLKNVRKTPPTPTEIVRDQPGAEGASTLSRLVVESEESVIAPAAKANVDAMPHTATMKDWMRQIRA